MSERAPVRLRLYIAGNTLRSRKAVRTLARLVEKRLPDRAVVEVIDVYQQAEAARRDEVVAVPTLIRHEPRPRVRVFGDLSDEARVLKALQLEPDGSPAS